MTTQELQEKLHEQKNKIGLVGGSVTVKEYDESEHPISAHINPEGWDIIINLRKGFSPIQDKRQKAYARKKKITNPLETLVLHIGGLHEPAHWELPYGSQRGCPFDLYNHDKILEAVKQALPNDKHSHASYVTNAFEDLVINPRCKEFNSDFSGQIMFWDLEGLSTKEKSLNAFTPFYEAFVKLNMHLFGDNSDKALLKRHYSNSPEVNKAVSNTINDLSLPENIQDTTQLFIKDNWPRMASTFAKNLVHLLEQAPIERLSAFSTTDKDQDNKNQTPGNSIEQKLSSKEGKEEISYGRYSSGDQQSSNYTSYEQLDSLYRTLARSIPINVEAMTRSHDLQIAPLTFRAFDEETDNPRKIKASKLFITDIGLTFGYPNQPLTIQAESKIQRRSFPDFKMLVIDNSGSMKEAIDGSNNVGSEYFIPWGDNSKYHFALLGHYGIENFLQSQQIAQYIQHGLSLFSSGTRYKEAGFQGLDEVRRFALNPDWGSTNIDASVLSSALKGRESFVLSISDGEIHNWNSEKSEVKKLAEQNYYAHIQIGSKTRFSNDLESWGIPVFPVTSGDDLSHLMVDITKKTYENFIHS